MVMVNEVIFVTLLDLMVILSSITSGRREIIEFRIALDVGLWSL